MKILCFSDIHGSADAMKIALDISRRERPQKTVVCGDLFGGRADANRQIVEILNQFDSILYVVRGNNDLPYYDGMLPCGFEDNAVMYHFSRTLFFTHGDRYNAWRVPPILNKGDVLVYGHTHLNSLTTRNGLYVANVGSIACPRDNQPSYMILDETGITTRSPDGVSIYHLDWQ